MRIPIAFKLIILTVLLLLGVTVPIARQNSIYLESVSRLREEDNNLEFAGSKSTEIEYILSNLVEKVKSAAIALQNVQREGKNESQEFELSFSKDQYFLGIEVFEIPEGVPKSIIKKVKSKFETYEIKDHFLTEITTSLKISLNPLLDGKFILLNGTLSGRPPALFIGIPTNKDAHGKITHLATAAFSLATLQKPFSEPKERISFVLDSQGNVLAHADEQKAINRESFSDHPLVSISNQSFTPKGQKPIRDPDGGNSKFYGAFSKTNYGVTVYSLISEDIILEPSHEIKRKAYLITGYFLSGCIFLIFLFSMSLTSPIETLADLIPLVSKVNFDLKATARINSLFKDEVVELAAAFDHMTVGLKERDKVKSLFSKFHGSSVTEDLMKGEVSLGGQNKEVIVFFSDIRGFTAFSEKRSPEEVVEMLNEYFGAMVSVINKHHGVVDKFIGDAIMAVWGAPKGSPKDAHHAVRACIDMRIALDKLNKKRISEGKQPIQIGMGLHAGRAISGNIGSDERMEYTVIGNTVNTGSRIEASTKAFGSDLLISDDVLNKIGKDFLVEYAGSAEVKGRSEPLKLYKVRGYRDIKGEMIEVTTPYSDYQPEHADKVKVSA